LNRKIIFIAACLVFLCGFAITVVAQSSETALFKTLFSPAPDKYSVIYEVKRRDTLTKISKEFHQTTDLIRRTNHLKDDRLSPGTKLKIPTCRLSLVIDKSQNTLVLKAGEEILKTYTVSTGKNNSTPVGVFKVTDKLIHPTWYKAGAVVPFGSPENELGTRWMGITAKGYGIHGTIHPETIGQQVTAGCVRMLNEEAEELYSLIPSGTEVTIID